MSDTATHPPAAVLEAFALGKLGAPDSYPVEEHLSACELCQEHVAAVPPDTLVEAVAAARTTADAVRSDAPTPTLDGAATPPAFAPTQAWGDPTGDTPGTNANGLAAEVPAVLASHPKYRVVRRLGVGGMGTVWLAEHTVMNRPVAVKVIRPDLLARPGATSRFLREVRAAAKLNHPNIVTAFDAEPAGDSCLLVMEYVPGETLGERLAAGPLPIAEACRAARDAARGLAHAHAHGLVHRDVKPHNLIRAKEGTTKVLDFGLAGVGAGEVVAADGDGLTGAGMVVGTPHYIAPEQVTDPHTADARADIYGLGCTLYHLLAGRPPFPDGTIAETLAAQQNREPEPIPGLPASLAAVLAKMTAKRPEDRYQSADEVGNEMEAYFPSNRSDLLDRIAKSRRTVRKSLRSIVAVATILVCTIVAAGVVFKIYCDNQEITITTDDPDIEVVMKRKGEVVRVIDKKSGQQWDIDTTKNEIAQADTPDGLTLDLPKNEAVVLRRNGKEVFSVTRVAKAEVTKIGEITAIAHRQRHTIDNGSQVRALAYTPDGNSLIVGGDDVNVFDPASGKPLHQEKLKKDQFATQLSLSADGKTVAVGYQQGIMVLDLTNRKRIKDIPVQSSSGFTFSLALTPDATSVVYGSDGNMRFHDLNTDKKETVPITQKGGVFGLRYSPDGRYLVNTANDLLSILDAKTRAIVDKRFIGRVGLTDISKDGNRLVILSSKEQTPMFSVFGLPDANAAYRETNLSSSACSLSLSPDGNYLALGMVDGNVQIWDLNQKKAVASWRPEPIDPTKPFMVASVAFAPGGKTLATGVLNTVKIWDLTPERAGIPKPDHELIQGTWRAVSGERDGDLKFTPDELMQITMTFAGETASVTQPGARHQGTFTLDQTKSPKHITVTGSEAEKFRGNFGIYSLDGDTLKICMSDAKMGRPTKFASRDGDKLFVNIVLKREAVIRRNPFGVPDVEDPDGGEVQAFAAKTKLADGADDPNAEQWVTQATKGDAGSLDGEWYGRWKHPGEDWTYCKGTARVKTVGDRVYILYTDHQDTFLMDLRREKNRLVGRAQGTHKRDDNSPCVLIAVGPDRLDGEFGEGGDLRGRQDFRRKLSPVVGNAADRAAAEYVLSIGGSVRVDDKEKDIKAAGELPKEPFRLTYVDLKENRKVTDAGLNVFQDCKDLATLDLNNTAVTDAGMAHLKGCRGLRVLSLDDTAVTDAGLALFKDHQKLEDLYFNNTRVTDAGLAPFKDSNNLETLAFGETQVTDAGLAHIKDLPKLTTLWLYSTKVTDAGLAHLKDAKSLTHLELRDLRISHTGLAHLKDCKTLTYLDLQVTGIDDAGLKHLAGLTKLTHVYLMKTPVTAAGIEQLKKALPACRIEWDGGVIPPAATPKK